MKLIVKFSLTLILLLLFFTHEVKSNPLTGSLPVFEADNSFFQYLATTDFSNVKKPRFWSPGVYIKAKFKGTYCELLINDQELWGKNHNYL